MDVITSIVHRAIRYFLRVLLIIFIYYFILECVFQILLLATLMPFWVQQLTIALLVHQFYDTFMINMSTRECTLLAFTVFGVLPSAFCMFWLLQNIILYIGGQPHEFSRHILFKLLASMIWNSLMFAVFKGKTFRRTYLLIRSANFNSN